MRLPNAVRGPQRAASAAPDLPAAGVVPVHGPHTEPRKGVDLPPWFRRGVVTVILFVLISWVAVDAFVALAGFWYILFISFFVGLVIEPAVNRLCARGMKRGSATGLVMFGVLLATILFFTTFGGLLASQLAGLIRQVPTLLQQLIDWVNHRFATDYSATDVLSQLGIGTADLAKTARNVGLGLLQFLGQAVGAVFSMFMILLFTFYFAADGPQLRRTIASWLTQSHQRTFLTVWDISAEKAGGYVISRSIMAVISAIFHGLVFALLGVPYWLPMALWVGLVSQFIPTIGTYLAGALPILLALSAGSWVKALVVLGAVVVYQQLENYYVQPRITRSTLQIHPAVAFGSVIVGTSLFGATGALLAIPVVATLQSVISTYGRRYELVSELAGGEGTVAEQIANAELASQPSEQPATVGAEEQDPT